jgi:ribosomal protein S18
MGIDLFGILQSIWAMRLGKFPKKNNPLRRIRGEERIRYEAIELLPKYITEYERIAGKR